MRKPLVEILTFEGCPTADAALALARQTVEDLQLEAVVRRVDVAEEATASELGFLGSPTIRVNGRDVERTRPARSCSRSSAGVLSSDIASDAARAGGEATGIALGDFLPRLRARVRLEGSPLAGWVDVPLPVDAKRPGLERAPSNPFPGVGVAPLHPLGLLDHALEDAALGDPIAEPVADLLVAVLHDRSRGAGGARAGSRAAQTRKRRPVEIAA